MPVSSGPYRNGIPFVSIQQISLDSLSGRRGLSVSLKISNEVDKIREQVEFGTVVYFTTSRQTAMLASTNGNILIGLITGNFRDTTKEYYSLSKNDFEYKAFIDPAKQKYIYHNVVEKEYKLQDAPDLYVVVASYREYKGQIALGNACYQAIVVEGRPPLSANLYRLKETVENYGMEGSIWPGPVHRHENKIMAGAFHTEQKHPVVSVQRVQNIKIKDYRILAAATNLSLAATPVVEKSPLISRGFLSRNTEGIVHGNFSFDRLRYAQEQTRFGQTIQNREALLSCLRIDDVRIYRKRINNAATGNSLTPGKPSHCGIQETNGYIQVASLENGLEIVNTAFSTAEILAMSFVDPGAASFNAGVLEYKIEIVATDLTIEAMTNIQNSLLAAASSLRPSQTDGWDALINEYLTAVQFIWGATATQVYSLPTWKKNLLALVATSNNNETDRQRVLETVQATVALLNDALAPGTAISSRPFSVRSKINNLTREPIIRTNVILETRYVLSDRKNVGLDYLDDVITRATSATPAVSYTGMISRTDSEISKYGVRNPDSISSNKYGYLSPAAVNLGDASLPTAQLELEQDAFLPLLVGTVSDSGKMTSVNQNSATTNRRNLLQRAGIGLTSVDASLSLLVQNPESVLPITIDARKYLSTDSPFNTDGAATRSNISGSETSIIRAKTSENEVFRSTVAEHLVGASILGFQSPVLVNQSSITGSMALKRVTQIQDTNASLNGISNTINFDSLTRIEYLHSFDPTLRVKQPMWKELDSATFEKIQNSNGTILCRLASVTNTLEGSALINLEPLGSLFIIGNPQTEKTFEGYKSVLGRLIRSTRLVASKGVTIAEANQIEIYYSKDMVASTNNVINPRTPQRSASPMSTGQRTMRGSGY